MPAVRPVRQRPPGPGVAGDRQPLAPCERPGARLGDRSRKFGRRICGGRRTRPSRPAAGSRDRCFHHDSRRRRAYLPLRLRARALATAQVTHDCHQIECTAARHGDVGRDRRGDCAGISGRDVRQDAGRRDDHAHDAQAREPGYDRGLQSPCRHPVRSRGGACRLAWHRADRIGDSLAAISLDVRADPRLGVRYRRQGNRQSDRLVLDWRHDARTSRRKGRRGSLDAGNRARDRRPVAAHSGPWRRGHDARGDRRDHRGDPGRQRLEEAVLNEARLPDIGFESYDSMEGLIAIERGAPPARFASWPGAKLIHAVYPGLLVAGTIALAATWLAQHYTAPVMLFALLFGMAFHFLHEEGRCVAGIEFASRSVLRAGVALLGMRITLGQIVSLGALPVLTVIVAVATTIAFGFVLSRRLGLPSMFGVLSGGSVAICGASAALAIASVLPRSDTRERDTILTVVSVTALSTIAMIIYPIFSTSIGLDHRLAGIFIGGTIHDVAQVVGAGYTISNETGDIATYVKLLRVAMLLPAVFAISFLYARNKGPGESAKATLPMFLVGFAALVVLNSIGLLPKVAIDLANDVSRWCLVAAIAALGMKTSFKALFAVGWRPVGLMVAETLWIAVLVLLSVKMII